MEGTHKTHMERLMAGIEEHLSKGSGMTNDLLERMAYAILGEGGGGSCHFAGVFAADRLPPDLVSRPRFSFIVNLDPWFDGEEEGETAAAADDDDEGANNNKGHFVTVMGYPDCVMFLDSYGMPCKQKHVLAFFRECGRPVECANVQVQDFGSVFCGLYALLFLSYIDVAPDFDLEFYRGKTHLHRNDARCVHYLRKVIDWQSTMPAAE